MNVLHILAVLKFGALLTTLGVAGYMDWRSRDIDPRVWVPIYVLASIDLVYRYLIVGYSSPLYPLAVFSIVSDIVVVLVFFLVTLLRLSGGADLLAMLAIVLSYPMPEDVPSLLNNYRLFPPSIAVLIYVGLVILMIFAISIARNTLMFSRCRNYFADLSIRQVIVYLLFSQIVRVRDLFEKRFLFPVYVPGLVKRMRFDVYEDDIEWRNKLATLPQDMCIFASWGLPMVTIIAIATLLYVVFGDPVSMVILPRWK